MSMILCGRDDVLDLMHPKYVQACEKQNPGLVERTIEAVSGEIGDALSYRYPQPWPYVPELVRYIATAISAYRVVGGITSLMDTCLLYTSTIKQFIYDALEKVYPNWRERSKPN